MKRKWNKLISGAICVCLALPSSIVYADEPGSVQEYDSGLEAQSERKDDTGMLDLAAENMDDVEIYDAAQESVEPEAAENTADGAAEATAAEDDSLLFSASDNEEDVFTDGNSDVSFSADEDPVMAAGESVPIDEAHFPDNNFRDYLLDWEITFGNEDGILDAEEINQITEISAYDFSGDDGSGANDYAGIEYLTALEELTANTTNSAVSFSLDVSRNVKLKDLSISLSYEYDYETEKSKYLDNQNIIFGDSLASLENLDMYGVVMDSFDASVFPGITQIHMSRCSIENIFIKECEALSVCDISAIDNVRNVEFGKLPALTTLSIYEIYHTIMVKLPTAPNLESLTIQARLSEIVLPNYPKLTNLELSGNGLKELKLHSCPNLEQVDVSYNELTSLDVTGLTKLNVIKCWFNNLAEIKGETDKFAGYSTAQRTANINLYSNILYTNQIWGDDNHGDFYKTFIQNSQGLTPQDAEVFGNKVEAAYCLYFTVDSFKGDRTDVSFDLYVERLKLLVPVTLHLTKTENTKLNVPTSVFATPNGDEIYLYWWHVLGADGYYVYRKVNDSAYKKIATVKGGNNFFADKTNTWAKYSYKVKAYGKVKGKTATSKYSKESSCINESKWKPKLTAKPGTKSAALTWKKLNVAMGYQIYRATSKKGKYTKVATIKKGTTVKYTDSKLKAKRTYYYKIRPYLTVSKKNIYGSFSGIVNVKTK